MADNTTSPKGDFISLLNQRLKLAKSFSKKHKDKVKAWIKDYNIDTLGELNFEGLENKMQIPYIFATIESNLPAIFETMPNIIMTQRGKEDKGFTDFASQVWDYIVDITKLDEVVEDVGLNFLVTGQGTVKYGWDLQTEKVQQQAEAPIMNTDGTPAIDATTGQPLTQIVNQDVEVPVKDQPFVKSYGYKDIEYSPESKFVLDDEDNLIPYVVFHHSYTPDQVEEMYGTKLKDTAPGKLDLKDLMGTDDVETDKLENKDDLERVDVYEYFGTLPKEYAKDKNWKSSKVYYVVFTKAEVVKKPVLLEKKPVLQIGNYGFSTAFHRFGEPKVLRELEQDISLGRSRIADIRDKQGTKIWLPQGTEADEVSLKKPADFTILRGMGQQPPIYVTPPPLPESILDSITMSRQDLQMASAQLDISRGGDSNTVDTATGQKIFQAATDKRNGRKKKKIGTFIRALARNLLVLCATNWDIDTFVKITDLDADSITQAGYLDKLKDLGKEYDVEIEIESITSNKETMSAQAIALYRETKEDPLVNRTEILKDALQIGFGKKDFERYLSGQQDPETILATLKFLVESGLMPQPEAEQIAMNLQAAMGQGQAQPGNNVGRPPSADPTAIMQKSMPGADSTQITAQNDAAYKQQGVARGPQNAS